MRSAVLIHNPAAGRGHAPARIAAIVERLRRGGYDTEVRPTAGPRSATLQAAQAATDGVEALFVFGGDGTLREAAGGLIGSRTVLGFIPGGTINVNTLTFGLPGGALAAAEALGSARATEFDVGLCNDQPFLMQASAGVDAELIGRLSSRLKRTIAGGAALPAGFGAWAFYRYPRIQLTADGDEIEGSLAIVSNIRFYGGRWLIQPDARPDDRRLDLVLFRGRGRSATLGFARDLVFGRHLGRRDVESRQVSEVELRGPRTLPIQIDGDLLGELPPARIRLAPDRLRVLTV